ncbi:hypothetical protein GCM10011415_07470 [Salipiger pallidus]|uniref:Uncharacterized protein n=1 Tax=Salipiger pallidus TaxID=1775170 RepID=A0A8J2ZHB0_9RHOB|nr:hypothetical protein [Salipiger pallidus]GGG63542.1 hypothetical protein GCM10011415_07470 [Salipiger pallidus]
MDIILHLGAHRTGAASFHCYLRSVDAELAGLGIGFWGPQRTRQGLFHGLYDAQPNRAPGRVRLAVEASRRRGLSQLLVTDVNMLGTPRACLRARALYPGAGDRLARVALAFPQVTRIVLQIRSPEMWWASLLAYLMPRGLPLPEPALLDEICAHQRSWRQVIPEIAAAWPGADIVVTPFERFTSRPDQLLRVATGLRRAPPLPMGGIWAHRSPDLAALADLLRERGGNPAALPQGEGRFMPFAPHQLAPLRERYADDLFWLHSGAGGLARLTEDPESGTERPRWPPAPTERGQDDDSQTGRLAHSG